MAIEPEKKHGAVIDGKIHHLAVTKIQRFNEAEEGCPLRWWYSDVQGRKEAQRTWHETGDSVDAQWTHYLQTGDDVLGRIARPGVQLLPAPGVDLLLQWGLNDKPRPKRDDGSFRSYFPPEESKVTAAGVPLIGFIDLLNDREQYLVPVIPPDKGEDDAYGNVVELRSEPGVVEVLDFKTTKNFTYAKKASELRRNTQMNGYGKFIDEILPGTEAVRLSHGVFLTEGSAAVIKRSVLVPMSEIRSNWRGVDAIAERMKSVAGTKNERDVQGNLAVCNSFGGCPHRDYCWCYRSTNSIKRLKMGLLKGRQSAPNGASPAVAQPNGVVAQPGVPQIFSQPQFQPQVQQAPVQQAPVPVQQFTQQPVQQVQQAPQADALPAGYIWAKDAVQGEAYFIGNTLAMYLVQSGGEQRFLPIQNGQAGGQPFSVPHGQAIFVAPPAMKPQAQQPAPQAQVPPPPVQSPQVVREASAPPPPPPLQQQVPSPAFAPPNFAPGATQVPSVAAPAAQGEPKKRTRRTNAQIAADAAAQGGQPVQAAQQGTVFKLCINTIPNEPFTDLAAYVADAAQALQEQFGVLDIRVAPPDSPLGFAKWKGMLAQVAKQDPPPPGTYVAFTRGNELTEVVAEALAPLVAPGCLQRGV